MNFTVGKYMGALFLKKIIVTGFTAMMLFTTTCLADTDYVTITMPEKILLQSIQSILPLNIDPRSDLMEGNLVLDSIDRFTLGANSAQVHGLVLGKNIVLNTRIGAQEFRLKVGDVRFSLTCDFTFRYDPKKKNLYITPYIADSVKKGSPGQVNKILPILALLNNQEYPVSLAHLQGMQTKIGQRQLSVAMEPVDIQFMQSQLVLKMIPKVSKTK